MFKRLRPLIFGQIRQAFGMLERCEDGRSENMTNRIERRTYSEALEKQFVQLLNAGKHSAEIR